MVEYPAREEREKFQEGKAESIGSAMNSPYGESVGQYLKRRRESRSVSLEEIAIHTRISMDYLEALERDDFQFFPRKDYIEGFLRSYARCLGLDGEEVLRRYHLQREMARLQESFEQIPLFPSDPPIQEAHPSKRRNPLRALSEKFKKISPPGKILWQIGIVIGALVLSFYLRQLLKSNDPPSKPVGSRAAPSSPVHPGSLHPKHSVGKAR
jgi:cytoskeletal protein RodZ